MREKRKNIKLLLIILAIVLVVLIAVGVSVKASGNTSGIAKSVTFTDNMDGAYVYFRAVDAAGNVGEWSEPQRIWIDNTVPTVTAKESSVTIKEGDVNALEDYFTVVANGSNADVDVVCTIGGVEYTTTETLTVEGSPYTVVCTATKNGGKSGNASMELVVESAVPPVTIVANQSSVLATKGIATTFESMFTITTTGDITGVSKTYAIDGVTTSAIDTSALEVDTYTLTCNATLNGVTASADLQLDVEPDFSRVAPAHSAGDIGIIYIPIEAVEVVITATLLSNGEAVDYVVAFEHEVDNGMWFAWTRGHHDVYMGGDYDLFVRFKKENGDFFKTTVFFEDFNVGPMCFVAGTKVYTSQGVVNIEDIKIGDIVYSMNMETMQLEQQIVENTYQRKSIKNNYIICVEKDSIETTAEHRFYVKNKGWIRASLLEIGDILISAEGEEKAIEDIQRKDYTEPIPVYNLEVANNHNYFVGTNKILVHNAY